MSDQELVDSARTGEAAALRRLYDRHAPRVYAVTRRLISDEALAEDCAQETWMRALRALDTFRGGAAFSTWLHRIAINTALAVRRNARKRTECEASLEDAYLPAVPGRTPLLRVRLEHALRALPDRMRQVLVLHDVEGFTHQQIGEMLGIEAGTSKSQLFRARSKMRERLKLHRAAAIEQLALSSIPGSGGSGGDRSRVGGILTDFDGRPSRRGLEATPAT
jgi:RNA polymerase sigma-70 factor (ECF subfamily)